MGARIVITGISAATGTCFAVLAGLSASAMMFPVRRFHAFSVVMVLVGVGFAYRGFRAAITGRTDEETLAASLVRGMIGAFIALLAMVALLLLLRLDTYAFLAHALGKPASSFTTAHLLIASVLLGFGAGFVVRMPAIRA